MDSAAHQPSGRNHWPAWLLLVTLCAYAMLLWRYAYVHPGGSDSSGYFNTAKLLADGRIHAPIHAIEGLPPATLPAYVYVPLGFRPDVASGNLTPTYPIGLSLFLVGSSFLFGPAYGPQLMMILHAVSGAWLAFALARTVGCDPLPALLAAVTIAVSPLTFMYALQCMSDVPAMVWVMSAVWLAWLAHRSAWAAPAAGFALGVAVLVRPSNLLALLPVLCALGWSWRRWLLLGLGGLPCAGLLAWFNHHAYGSAFASGYGNVDELLSARWILPSARNYVQWLPAVASPLVVLVLGFPWRMKTPRRTVLLLGAWLLPFLGFYLFYFHTQEAWWYLRFLLPALPALVIAALLVGQHWAGRLLPSAWRIPLWFLLAAVVLGSHRHWNRHWDTVSVSQNEAVYAEASSWLQTHVPPDTVLTCMQLSGALFYYTDLTILRWDTLDGSWPRVRAGLQVSGRPVYGAFFDFEETRAMREEMPGHWTKIAQVQQVSIWRLQPAD